MDPRAHMQHQTDIIEDQARGIGVRRHVAAHQRRLKAVGPSGPSADHAWCAANRL